MDETEGLIAMPAIGAKEAVFQAAQTDLTWTAGEIDGAAQMNGASGGYFRIDLNGAIPVGTDAMTIAMWVNPTANNVSYEGLFMTRADHGNGDFGPTGDGAGDGNLGFAWESGDHIDSRWSGALDSDGGSVVAGNWYHVAVVWDGANGTQTQYINGEAATLDPGAANGGTLDSGGVWHLGNDSCCGNREFNGLVDDVAVWDEAVSAADIAELFAKTKSPADINPPTDNDGDGLPNEYEDMFPGFLDKETPDADQDVDRVGGELAGALMPDGLDNAAERAAGTDPTNPDTDGDGLLDGAEIDVHGTNPLLADTDGDNISDGEEVVEGVDGFVTNPLRRDTDFDTINDDVELASDPPSDPTNGQDPPPPAMPTEGLVALYRMDETSGTVAADSATADGEQNATGTIGEPAWVAGLIGGAGDFDGDIMEAVDPLGAGTEAFTVTGWANPDGQADYAGIFMSRVDNWGLATENGPAAQRFDLRFDNVGVGMGGSTGLDTEVGSAVADEWHHLAITWTTDGFESLGIAYHNGVEYARTTTSTLTFVEDGLTWFIGADLGRTFNGQIDDLSIWNVALDPEDVASIYRNGIVGVGITPPEGIDFRITSIVRNPDGSLDLTWNSDPTDGVTYKILYNGDLSLPLDQWADSDDGFPTGGETTSYTVPANQLVDGLNEPLERVFVRIVFVPVPPE